LVDFRSLTPYASGGEQIHSDQDRTKPISQK
jgi:hypothetical protein